MRQSDQAHFCDVQSVRQEEQWLLQRPNGDFVTAHHAQCESASGISLLPTVPSNTEVEAHRRQTQKAGHQKEQTSAQAGAERGLFEQTGTDAGLSSSLKYRAEACMP